jgi:hypothetical protein
MRASEEWMMDVRTRQNAISEGYFLGCQLRRLGATDSEWRANAENWCDGPRGRYRGHELRAYFAKGLEAGYRDLIVPQTVSLEH